MRHVWMFAVAGLALAGCATSGQTNGHEAGSIAIAVTEKGFTPAEVAVTHGAPVTLVVTRKTDRTCAKEFVMTAQGIHEPLPLNQPVTITFTPTEAGELRFACAMDMIAGKVVVR